MQQSQNRGTDQTKILDEDLSFEYFKCYICWERNNGLWNYKTFTHTGFAAVINFWANSISGKLL